MTTELGLPDPAGQENPLAAGCAGPGAAALRRRSVAGGSRRAE
jgi:hypothetical protein